MKPASDKARIPVYEISAPEYRIKNFEHLSGKIHRTRFGVEVPIEYWENKPDFDAIGKKIAASLRKHFLHKRIGLRMLSSAEHPGRSADDLIKIIKEIGHDRYDLGRRGDRYENIDGKRIDLFALEVEIGAWEGEYGEIEIRHALESFYTWPFQDHRLPIRVDLGIVYDLSHLEPVAHRYKGREGQVKTDGYVFKDPSQRSKSVLAILKILG